MAIIPFNQQQKGPQIHYVKNTYTILFGFDKDGLPHQIAHYRPHWKGCFAVWRILEKRYLPPFIPEYVKQADWYVPGMSAYSAQKEAGRTFSRLDPGCEGAMQTIYSLVNSKRLTESERIVLATTLDDVLVKNEDIPKVVSAFRDFKGDTSLPLQAYTLERRCAEKRYIAFGWGHSEKALNWDSLDIPTVSSEKTPYNCVTMHSHRWLFEVVDMSFKK